ncbi:MULTISPECIES: glucose 1-dehydrogenase [Methylosinus]|uniref:3-oxoacyl-ACP reductase n=1 Tax=Methylosinus trichosporium (strain ATCC 35070 / NCIMB 11131 / UNIQEM 75 / OB3b) TaxID=595536 RepID=A0A2D2D111_METT3|nr:MULTISPECIES: glucose 1-dehydrogenase [Methylosinus]ATQ68634.1 3-oxoacyl-ACP reductase [Methylosinus trichosporium OB3b]OBS53201.1 oxidoreductase [Methylosinus sp. 3S-1]
MGKLQGKIAVVTGGSSGIGLATAKLFAAEGAKVVITGRRKPELEAAVAEIGSNAFGVQGDVAKLDDLDRLYAEVKARHGRIDILFANAGLARLAPLEAVDEAHFDLLFGVNVKGLLFTVQKALPLFSAGGAIVLNSSVANTKGMPAFGVYSATKAAVRSFVRSWTSELKDRGIRVNAISPGPIETPIFDTLGLPAEQVAEFGANISQSVPLGRFGRPEEIAAAVLFLASDAASYVAGVDLYADGGMVAV